MDLQIDRTLNYVYGKLVAPPIYQQIECCTANVLKNNVEIDNNLVIDEASEVQTQRVPACDGAP